MGKNLATSDEMRAMAANMRHWAGKTSNEIMSSKMRRCADELEHAVKAREMNLLLEFGNDAEETVLPFQ